MDDLAAYGQFASVLQVAALLRSEQASHRTVAERVRAMAKAGKVETLSMVIERMLSPPPPEPGAHLRELLPGLRAEDFEPVDAETLR